MKHQQSDYVHSFSEKNLIDYEYMTKSGPVNAKYNKTMHHGLKKRELYAIEILNGMLSCNSEGLKDKGFVYTMNIETLVQLSVEIADTLHAELSKEKGGEK